MSAECDRLTASALTAARAVSVALVQSRLQTGETVRIDFPLGMTGLSTVAIVRYSSKLRSGFEFVGLTLEERGQITAASSPFARNSH